MSIQDLGISTFRLFSPDFRGSCMVGCVLPPRLIEPVVGQGYPGYRPTGDDLAASRYHPGGQAFPWLLKDSEGKRRRNKVAAWRNGIASDYESGDCRFDPCGGHNSIFTSLLFYIFIPGPQAPTGGTLVLQPSGFASSRGNPRSQDILFASLQPPPGSCSKPPSAGVSRYRSGPWESQIGIHQSSFPALTST